VFGGPARMPRGSSGSGARGGQQYAPSFEKALFESFREGCPLGLRGALLGVLLGAPRACTLSC